MPAENPRRSALRSSSRPSSYLGAESDEGQPRMCQTQRIDCRISSADRSATNATCGRMPTDLAQSRPSSNANATSARHAVENRLQSAPADGASGQKDKTLASSHSSVVTACGQSGRASTATSTMTRQSTPFS